ncbi:MAG: LacI family transcriptional regulator [Alicyclobacillus sp.]|nr:LacI family transcriptional regulator [Alicyclobacillus sp.]
MTTIKDVAKAARVAVSTASLALRNDPRVKESTRRRVLEAANRLKYTPHGIARDLKVRRTGMACLLIRDLGGPFYSELTRGVQSAMYEHGYETIVSGTMSGKRGFASRMLMERRVDGVIVLSPDVDDETIRRVASEHLPIVLLDRDLSAPHVYAVRADNLQGGYMATRHLLDLGYRDIVYLGGARESADNLSRYEGFVRAMTEFGLDVNHRNQYSGNFTEEGGYMAALMMHASGPLPEAVFAANDEMAIGVLRAFGELGIRVPQDVALVGFDDIQLAQYVTPPLTTVRQPMYKMGLLAGHMLVRALNGEAGPERITLPTELIVRESSKRT